MNVPAQSPFTSQQGSPEVLELVEEEPNVMWLLWFPPCAFLTKSHLLYRSDEDALRPLDGEWTNRHTSLQAPVHQYIV